MANPRLTAVILDYGGVLSYPPGSEQIGQIANLLNVDVDLLQKLYHLDRLGYDRGDLTAIAYWTRFAEHASAKIDTERIEEIRALDVEMWNKVNPNMVEWVPKLCSAGIKTALLSNMISDVVLYARRNFQWLTSFDYALLSSEVGLVKPDAAIFELCLQFLGVPPSEALFVDDSELNIHAARTLGMVAVKFQSVEQLRNELAELNFEILPNP